MFMMSIKVPRELKVEAKHSLALSGGRAGGKGSGSGSSSGSGGRLHTQIVNSKDKCTRQGARARERERERERERK